jgi:hypothetical protein
MFPGDKEMHFRVPYEMCSEDLLRDLLAGARFEPQKIEKVRVTVEGVDARDIATGQVRGTPRSLLLDKRGVDLDLVIEKVTAALEAAGGKGTGFRGDCQAIAVEAVAPAARDEPAVLHGAAVKAG